MAYSVKWAVFRTRKIRVVRLIRLFSRPWRTCGKFWAIKSTKRLLWASEEVWPKEDMAKMKSIWKISSVGRMRRWILIVIRTILSFSWDILGTGIGLLREVFLDLGFSFIDGILVWMPDEMFGFWVSISWSDIGLPIDVNGFDLPIREICQLFLD